MKIKDAFRHLDGEKAWQKVVDRITAENKVITMTGLCLTATFVGKCIFLKGGTPGTKRAEKGEYLTAKDFIAAYDTIREWDEINTGNVKPHIKRQQTPFIALLHSAGILE